MVCGGGGLGGRCDGMPNFAVISSTGFSPLAEVAVLGVLLEEFVACVLESCGGVVLLLD